MKIGFIKLGLKTYFKKNGSGQGSNHELVDIFNIFKNKGHECFMISGSDKYECYVDIKNLDYIFVFNGFLPTTLDAKINMMKQPTDMYKILNGYDVPYIYFWTDVRYDIKNIKVVRQPNIILSQEQENYGHLDKLILYKKKKKLLDKKTNKFGIVMNDTEPKRSKEVLKTLGWLGYGEIKGKWKNKNKWLTGELKEEEVNDYLASTKYSYNLATNHEWVSQKFWEMLLNNVICFYKNYDKNNLIIPKNDYRLVRDEIDVEEKIEELDKNVNLYLDFIKKQQNDLKEEYFNGNFIYNLIIKKL